MPSFGNALVASTTNRAGCTGVRPAGAFSASCASSAASSLIQRSRSTDAFLGLSLQRFHQLRHHTAEVTDQGDVNRTVDADGQRILFDQNPFALGVVLRPMARLAVVARFAELRAERDAQIGLHHRLDGRRRESVGEGAVLETVDERGAAGGLNHRALHQVGQLPDRRTGARCVDPVSDQQDRALRRPDQLRRFGHLTLTRGLVDEPIPCWAAADPARRAPRG